MTLLALPLMPEWWYLVGVLTVLSALGFSWPPLFLFAPLWLLALAAPLAQAALAAARATFPVPARSTGERWQRYALVFFMHLQQPIARLIGRRRHGLTPWRRRGPSAPADRAAPAQVWSEAWRAPEAWIESFESALRSTGLVVRRGGDADAWDLELHGGLLGSLRARFAVEEHGAGRQLVRLHAEEHAPTASSAAAVGAAVLAAAAAVSGGWIAAAALAAGSAALAWRTRKDQGHARAAWHAACQTVADEAAPGPGTTAPALQGNPE